MPCYELTVHSLLERLAQEDLDAAEELEKFEQRSGSSRASSFSSLNSTCPESSGNGLETEIDFTDYRRKPMAIGPTPLVENSANLKR